MAHSYQALQTSPPELTSEESGWTKEEILRYEPIDYEPLSRLYKERRLHTPDARAYFLAEIVLELTMTDHDIVLREAHQKGRPEALNALEKLVKTAHEAKIEREKTNIILPL